jgi:hypothetical protein
VHVSRVDPRDQHWQADRPVFRVYFWKALGTGAYESDEFEVRDADVSETLAWAENERSGRTYTLYLRRDEPTGPGLVLLAGTDPTANSETR